MGGADDSVKKRCSHAEMWGMVMFMQASAVSQYSYKCTFHCNEP